MSLNALGVSQLAIPALASPGGAAAGAIFSWGAAPYSGLLCPSKYDVILGTTGAFTGVGGISVITLNQGTNLNIVSVAQAAACIVEAWLIPPAIPIIAGATTIGAKYVGLVAFAGPGATCTLAACDGAGATVNFSGICGFRIYIPRVGYF